MDTSQQLKLRFIFYLILVSVLSLLSGNLLVLGLNVIFVLMAFLGGLIVGAQFLFPVAGWRARQQAFGVLWSWIRGSHRTSYVIRDSHVEERIAGDPFSYFGSGIVMVDSGTAVALFNGLSATRIIGPCAGTMRADGSSAHGVSVFFIDLYERVRGVVDLRWQLRSKQVSVHTRDGIELKIELSVDFTIERDPQRERRNRPYTYTDRAVHRAVYREAVCAGQSVKYDWTEAVLTLAEDRLRHVIAQYTLDQFFALEQADDPYAHIERQVSEELGALARSCGVQITGVSLGLIQAHEDIVAQRLESWRVAWENRKTIIKAQAEHEAKRREELARALAQTEMIQRIIQSLEGMGETPAHDVITLRLVGALERMSREPLTRERVPDRVRATLSAVVPPSSDDRKF